MTDKYGSNYNKANILVPSQKAPIGDIGGRVRISYDEHTFSADLLTTDKLFMNKIPKGAKILDLPIEVQKQIVVYNFSHANIRELRAVYRSTGDDIGELHEAVKKLKDAKDKGLKNISIQPKGKDGKRIRKKLEIGKMMEEIMTALEGSCLATRALAWASGEISDQDFFVSLSKTAEKEGKIYYPPDSFDTI